MYTYQHLGIVFTILNGFYNSSNANGEKLGSMILDYEEAFHNPGTENCTSLSYNYNLKIKLDTSYYLFYYKINKFRGYCAVIMQN